jgi:hypothetical protein
MKHRVRPSISEIITAFLSGRGAAGATLAEIYAAVKRRRTPAPSDPTMRSVVYRRLITARNPYRKTLERFTVGGQTRYRLRHT